MLKPFDLNYDFKLFELYYKFNFYLVPNFTGLSSRFSYSFLLASFSASFYYYYLSPLIKISSKTCLGTNFINWPSYLIPGWFPRSFARRAKAFSFFVDNGPTNKNDVSSSRSAPIGIRFVVPFLISLRSLLGISTELFLLGQSKISTFG